MKSNEMDRINMLENTFKPITKTLNVIAENFLKKKIKTSKYNVENQTTTTTTTTTNTNNCEYAISCCRHAASSGLIPLSPRFKRSASFVPGPQN